ncbi:hypothetical protein [Pseudoruegeria sp. SHC-113]|uniref:hypothetical protein n=1 Tax=Pseudoruegeria sp. SHC-113 TaxID=2855439 RepID=UPI0021BB1011|nr:hypothetical protein [Pseudoruegeria sp. SHC-113]MCT8158988.1 hypothetical protein [Pseudoruegeria sp. SHC-113]
MDSSLAELLEDAGLVAAYGRNTGKLNDTQLFEALQKAHAAQALSWGSPEVVEVQKALNAAVARIRPVSLVDLKSGWNPFVKPASGGKRTATTKIAFVIAAFFLIFVCGYLTVWQQQASVILSQVSALQSAREEAITNEVVLRILEHDAQTLADGSFPATTSVFFREKVRELRDLDERERTLIQHAQRQSQRIYPWVPAYLRAKAYFSTPVPQQSLASLPQAPLVEPAVGPQARSPCADHVRVLANPAGPEGLAVITMFGRTVQHHDSLIRAIKCFANIQSDSPQALGNSRQRLNALALGISNKVDILSRWWLPALYGALGAMMFTMRALLNPFLPDPGPVRILLRVFLGSFAGISIAWFWSGEPDALFDVSGISLGLLTIAFLFGFAIDVFFSLLDRLVMQANAAIGRIGADPPEAAES